MCNSMKYNYLYEEIKINCRDRFSIIRSSPPLFSLPVQVPAFLQQASSRVAGFAGKPGVLKAKSASSASIITEVRSIRVLGCMVMVSGFDVSGNGFVTTFPYLINAAERHTIVQRPAARKKKIPANCLKQRVKMLCGCLNYWQLFGFCGLPLYICV